MDRDPGRPEGLRGGYAREEILNHLRTAWDVAYVIAVNKIYKREVFRTLRYPEGRLHEDNFVVAELYLTIKSAACVEDALYYYRQRTGSIMQSQYTLRKLDDMWSFAHCFECFYRSGRMDMLPLMEDRMFAKVTGVYYRLSPQDRCSDAMKQARNAQKNAAKLLRQHGLLTKRALFRTVLFQAFPAVYGLRMKRPK